MRIGGSNIAGICGISPWSTPLDEYLKITGQITIQDNPAMYWGRALEPLIRQKYCEETGRIVRYNTNPELLGIPMQHPQLPYLCGSLDGISTESDGSFPCVLEIKTARDRRAWENGVPDHYQCQVQAYMACTGYQSADVAVLFGASDFDIFEVSRDNDIISLIEAAVQGFWENHLVPEIPPECTTPADRDTMWPLHTAGKTIQGNDDIQSLVQFIKSAKISIDELKNQIDEAEASIKDRMQDTEAIIGINGKPIVTWKRSKDSTMIDLKALQKKYPDIASEFTTTKPGSRRFVIK